MDIYKNVKIIIGDEIGSIIYDKIKKDCGNIPEKEFYKIVYHTCNYIDSNKNLTYKNLKDLNLNEVNQLWLDFLNNYKEKYNPSEYVEKNKIIFDYRLNGLGYYWVDLEKLFCIDSMIRMKDCGRVNYGNTTFELRETTENKSLSHVIIVYNLEEKLILQIKGMSSKLPNKKYWHLIHKFLLNFPEEINGYSPTFKPETDFKIQYLPVEEQKLILLRHPKLIF
jgi:hypothetical protein